MNNKMIVDERQRDIGRFLVGRLLPFRKRRNVGPFVFIDHMGPTELKDGKFLDVDQHPHIGLCTLTYLYEGQIEHKDSTGSKQIIKPGDAGFMSSGKGVTHTERTPKERRKLASQTIHGYQIWVALPKDKEEMEPRFDYYAADSLPTWEENGFQYRLVAGEGFGRQSPLMGYSPMFMVDVKAEKDGELNLREHLEGEIAFVIVEGHIVDGGEKVSAGQMLISKSEEACRIQVPKGTKLLLFGGESLPEERYLLWNFASSSKSRLQEARKAWEDKAFPKVPGDDTYIPIPV
ncbi:MAG: pirin family protein [Vicingaceae bacterium]